MNFKKLKEEVCEGNLILVKHGLVKLTWGNLSLIDESGEYFAIKSSGIAYDKLKSNDIIVLNFAGKIIESNYRPSSDTPTHILLLQAWKENGVHSLIHTHSTAATAFAQTGKELPCLGTTHADHFNGSVPITRILTNDEVQQAYEKNTGKVILERFKELNPLEFLGVLVSGHAQFAWGKDISSAVNNSVALEEIANMALAILSLTPNCPSIPNYILNKHYLRKHCKAAYYGQRS